MALPSIGSTVRILKTGEFGLVVDHMGDEFIKVHVATSEGRVILYIYKPGQFEIHANAEVPPRKFTPGQMVTVDVNGQPWTGRIAGEPNGNRYLVDLLIEFEESELTPFVIVNPGH